MGNIGNVVVAQLREFLGVHKLLVNLAVDGKLVGTESQPFKFRCRVHVQLMETNRETTHLNRLYPARHGKQGAGFFQDAHLAEFLISLERNRLHRRRLVLQYPSPGCDLFQGLFKCSVINAVADSKGSRLPSRQFKNAKINRQDLKHSAERRIQGGFMLLHVSQDAGDFAEQQHVSLLLEGLEVLVSAAAGS